MDISCDVHTRELLCHLLSFAEHHASSGPQNYLVCISERSPFLLFARSLYSYSVPTPCVMAAFGQAARDTTAFAPLAIARCAGAMKAGKLFLARETKAHPSSSFVKKL